MTIDPNWESYVRRTAMLDDFDRFLRVLGVIAIVVVVLCAWESTYDIKETMKQLRNKLSGVHDDH